MEESGAESNIEAQKLVSEKENLSGNTSNNTNDKSKSPLHTVELKIAVDLVYWWLFCVLEVCCEGILYRHL